MVTREPPGVHARRPIDEHANLITHALGLVLAIGASAFLMRQAIAFQPLQTIVATAAYCVSLVALYAASTLSHSFHDLQWRVFFRTVDQACIYLLIVGSFTPVAITYLWNGWWPILLACMWILAVSGVVLVLRMRNLSPIAKLTYGMLGWLPIISLKTLVETAPSPLLVWTIDWRSILFAGNRLPGIRPSCSIFPRALAHVCDCRKRLPLRGNSEVRGHDLI